MKKLLIAALAVSALVVETGNAAHRGVRSTPATTQTASATQKRNHAQTVKTELTNFEKAFETLWTKAENCPANAQRFLEAEQGAFNVFLDSVDDLNDSAATVDEDFIKDVFSEDQIKEMQAKTALYNTVVSVLGQIDSQVKSEISSMRNASNKEATVLAARETSIKERAQNILMALAFYDAIVASPGEQQPILANMCDIAQKIQHAERVENVDRMEEGIVAHLKSEKRFLESIGLATSRGAVVENLSYQAVASILTANLTEYANLANRLRVLKKNGTQDTTKIAKDIVALARKADDAAQVIRAYDARKANILERVHGIRNERRALAVMQTLARLEGELLTARKNLVMFDFERKSQALKLFYDRYYRSAAFVESTSWLRPILGLTMAALGGYYFFGTDKGKAQVEALRKSLPASWPGHIS